MLSTHIRFRTLGASAAFLACIALLSGCSRPVGSVKGTVTFNGKPLKGGSVTFNNTEGGPSASATIGEDGSYSIPKLTGGEYKVCIDTSFLKPSPGGPAGYSGSGGPRGPQGAKTQSIPKSAPPKDADIPEGYHPSSPADAAAVKNSKLYIAIPAKYGKPDTTDLSYNFPGGEQTHNIDIKDK